MDEVLAKLQSAYRRYHGLWEAWSQSSSCTLPTDDVYVINALIPGNFTIPGGTLIFYNKPSMLRALAQNLNRHYCKFELWAHAKFIEALAELKSVLDGYSPLWRHWAVAQGPDLSNEQTELVSELLKRGFDTRSYAPAFFCSRLTAIQSVTLKLQANYSAFQIWAIDIFRASLLWRGFHYNINTFLLADIDSLEISTALKLALKQIGQKNLLALVQTRHKKITDSGLFKLMMHAQTILLSDELAINNQKKKGGRNKTTVPKTFNNLNINLN